MPAAPGEGDHGGDKPEHILAGQEVHDGGDPDVPVAGDGRARALRRTIAALPRMSVTRSYSSAAATVPSLPMKPHFPSFSTAARPSKWGYLDKNGKEAVAARYEAAGSFSQGLAAVKENGRCPTSCPRSPSRTRR